MPCHVNAGEHFQPQLLSESKKESALHCTGLLRASSLKLVSGTHEGRTVHSGTPDSSQIGKSTARRCYKRMRLPRLDSIMPMAVLTVSSLLMPKDGFTSAMSSEPTHADPHTHATYSVSTFNHSSRIPNNVEAARRHPTYHFRWQSRRRNCTLGRKGRRALWCRWRARGRGQIGRAHV